VQEAAEELAREGADDLALPGLEHDRPRVLAARAVLRERLRPALAVCDDADASARPVVLCANPSRQARREHGGTARFDESRIRGVARDGEPERAGHLRQMPVTEVQPQEVAVGRFVGWAP
jgi:hypothetical protein